MSQISVSGEGKVEVKPNIAYFIVNIQAREESAEEVREVSEKCVKQVVNVLKDFIKDSNYTVTPPTISPNYEYIRNKRTVKGYNAQCNIPVRVDELEKISELVDVLNRLSPEQIQAVNISFNATKEKELMNEARTLALKDAKAKADHYASQFNLEVTELLSLVESGHTTRNHAKQMAFAACVTSTRGGNTEGGVEISPGELDITINIEAVFTAQPSRSTKNE